MRPDFSQLSLKGFATGETDALSTPALWKTPENIPVKSLYIEKDMEPLEHLGYAAGLPPFLRGPYGT
ncbi:MAG: hypothetical protein GYA22_08435, partial [Bacteroidales bacterium]|nr:hypothetical protein [Bacteroidales bacterium]